MSTPDQPSTPPLTRRQLRELRNTGATPVIVTPSPAVDDAEPATPDAASEQPTAAEAGGSTPAPAAPLPRPAKPVDVHTAPVPDAAVDLGAAPLTRRQARAQERIRTASVPVIGPDHLAAPAGEKAAPADEDSASAQQDVAADTSVPVEQDAAARTETPVDAAKAEKAESEAIEDETAENDAVVVDAEVVSEPVEPATRAGSEPESSDDASTPFAPTPAAPFAGEPVIASVPGVAEDAAGLAPEPAQDRPIAVAAASVAADAPADKPVLNPMFGAGLLAGEAAKPEPVPSFEQLLGRDTDTTGSVTAPSALIVSHTSAAPLVAPIAGTGEVLVTGTFALPEGLGSTGQVPGTADGKEIDAVLVDGELPAHSSPTPIAASAAVSTIKTSEDIIQPPTPEKGGKLMLTLAITAGVLALALVGVLVYALVTGVIS
ncbi:hypothetical protein [Microbacterium luticocti]|uniref:hypothetical protein n=1 Tax=Microbacterium luticocti TaxID=451764 RepID=UPI0004231E47|nr:hypothetical protein [Microbacterium luticocti]